MENWWQERGRCLASNRWKHHAGSRCWTTTVHCGPALDQGRRHSSHARTCPASQDPQTEFALLRESLGVRRINHILQVHGHTILQEQPAAEIYDEVGQRLLERLFPGFMEDSMVQATLGAGQSGIGYKRAQDIAAPAHLRARSAAERRIQAMIHDAVAAGLLLQHTLEARLDAVIVTSKPLEDEDRATPSSTFKKRPRQQRKRGSKQSMGIMGPESQPPDNVRPRTSQLRFSRRRQ